MLRMGQISSMSRVVSVLALSVAIAAGFDVRAQPGDAPDEVRQVGASTVALWRPSSGSDPRPLVLFSHGVQGCKDQSGYLMRALARQGMLVAAPDHRDNRCGLPFLFGLPDIFEKPQQWDDATYRDRRDQMHELRADILRDTTLSGVVDPTRVALVGHSLGGYTVLALAGARADWKMGGIAAAVALAPFTAPYEFGGDPGGITVPVLFQAGSQDPATETLEPLYANTPSPACRVRYAGARHFAWVDPEDVPFDLRQSGFQTSTIQVTVAFLQTVFAQQTPTQLPASSQAEASDCK